MPRYGLFINIHHFIISSFHENPTMIGTLAVCACLNQDLLPSERFTSDDIWDWPWVHSYDSKQRTTTLILVNYPWERTFSFTGHVNECCSFASSSTVVVAPSFPLKTQIFLLSSLPHQESLFVHERRREHMMRLYPEHWAIDRGMFKFDESFN